MNSFYSEKELKDLGLKHCGKNVLISRNTQIYGSESISIGNNVRIDDFCILSGKIIVGNYVHIAAACLLFGGEEGIVLEDFTGLSSRCAVYAVTDDYSGAAMTTPMVPDKYRNVSSGTVTFKKYSLIGTGCTILSNVTVGEGSSVGCMSLVLKNLEGWGIYVGIPCRRIKDRSKNLLSLEKEFLKE